MAMRTSEAWSNEDSSSTSFQLEVHRAHLLVVLPLVALLFTVGLLLPAIEPCLVGSHSA